MVRKLGFYLVVVAASCLVFSATAVADPTGDTYFAFTWRQVGQGETVSVDASEPLFLIRLRKAKELPGGTTVEMKPTDGVLVWIAEEP